MHRATIFFIIYVLFLSAFGSWQEEAKKRNLVYFVDSQRGNYIFLFGIHGRGPVAKEDGFFIEKSLENYRDIINPLILEKSKAGFKIVFFCESYNNVPTDIQTARKESGMINPISDYRRLVSQKVLFELGGIDQRFECQSQIGIRDNWMKRLYCFDTTFTGNTLGIINKRGPKWTLENIKKIKIGTASIWETTDNIQILKYLGPVSIEFKYSRQKKAEQVINNLDQKKYYIFLFGSAHYHEFVYDSKGPRKQKNILLLDNSVIFTIETVNAYLADYLFENYYRHHQNDGKEAPPPLEFSKWINLLNCAKTD